MKDLPFSRQSAFQHKDVLAIQERCRTWLMLYIHSIQKARGFQEAHVRPEGDNTHRFPHPCIYFMPHQIVSFMMSRIFGNVCQFYPHTWHLCHLSDYLANRVTNHPNVLQDTGYLVLRLASPGQTGRVGHSTHQQEITMNHYPRNFSKRNNHK